MSKKQRNVSENLGKNHTANHEKYYYHIESKIGPTKKCTFGHILGSKTGVKHEGEQLVLIRNFETKGCSVDHMGRVIIKCGDGLQGFCRNCSKRKRRKRLEMSREKNKGGYDTYEKEYGKSTKKCTFCNHDKCVRDHFKLSPGMECGIHNHCNECSKKYGESMGERLFKYRPDGNFKYAKTEKNQHDDHIMPLAYGGTNEEINHQILSSRENLSKSSSIPFENIMHINPLLLCSRWRPILYTAQREKISITVFKSRMSYAIREEQKKIYSMTDGEIETIFKQYNKNNNRRVGVKRGAEKFKTYCKEILKL
jgi:hypothetical protein